jgi:ketosteroid isomerase-like protein
MKTAISIVLSILLLNACHQKKVPLVENPNFVKDEIKKVLYNSVGGWALTKDTALLYSIIANDSNFIEVHPSKRVVKGIVEFKKAEKFWLDSRFKAVSCEMWNLNINLSKDGSVAWFYCMLNDINEWAGKAASWENTRWTGVLEKREGKWRIVQQHFSFAK